MKSSAEALAGFILIRAGAGHHDAGKHISMTTSRALAELSAWTVMS
jgi:hypothetical protein